MVRGRRNPAYYGLPDRLRRARRQNDLGMSAASLLSGMSTGTAFLIERRQTLPRLDTIERFASALGLSPSWLAYGDGPETTLQAEPSTTSIGQRLTAARKQQGLSRQALGNAAGLTGQTVANIEVHGMIPRVDTAEMLANELGISPSWLAFGISLTADHEHPSTISRPIDDEGLGDLSSLAQKGS